MTNDQIEQFLTAKTVSKVVNINFKKRNAIRGVFVNLNDFEDLKSKNLWRVITESRIHDWEKTRDSSLSRIYNGAEFTRLKAQ